MNPTTADVIACLKTDWRRLCASTSYTERVVGWLTAADVFAPADAPSSLAGLLDALEQRDRRLGRGHTDVWLAALLRQAAGSDAEGWLAVRVVVQAMVPSALRTARALLRAGVGGDEARAIAVSSLYEVVLGYRLERRPSRIAANIALDTLHLALREAQREGLGCDVPLEEVSPRHLVAEVVGPEDVAAAADLVRAASRAGLADPAACPEEFVGPYGEVVELLLWAQRAKVIDPEEVAAITGHFREGAPLDSEAAAAAGVRVATWKKRRSRAVAAVRQAVPQWQAAVA
ncbi:hypothetical protein ABZ832_28785 [Streptantibioticus parmotrematis]|uniref:hypothetical protein n=1 Tax=Streptantibioticus parmotrematis TaxID=2873249 RepID=UPI0034053617